jgi:hypothetical protein
MKAKILLSGFTVKVSRLETGKPCVKVSAIKTRVEKLRHNSGISERDNTAGK